MISEGELRTAHKQLRSEECIIREQLARVEEFSREPAPMDKAAFRRLAEYWTLDITGGLYDAPDEKKAEFAERFDLFATIRPDKTGRGYHVDLAANIPLEKDGAAYNMVFSPSGKGQGDRVRC